MERTDPSSRPSREAGNPSALFNINKAAPGVLCPVLGLPIQGRPRNTGKSPTEGYQEDQGTGAPLLWDNWDCSACRRGGLGQGVAKTEP